MMSQSSGSVPRIFRKQLDKKISVDPDQIAPQEQSDQDLHCLVSFLWNIYVLTEYRYCRNSRIELY